MKKLCMGTFLRILSVSKVKSAKQYVLIGTLLKTVQDDERYMDDKFQSALLSGKNNLSGYERILTLDKGVLVTKIENTVAPNFDEKGKKLIINCIRDILIKDTSISDSTIIGFDSEGFTKQDITTKQVFPFSQFLANLFYYVSVYEDNIPYKANIKKLSTEYFEEMRNSCNNIQIETETTHIHSKIKPSLDPKPFNDVFTEIKSTCLSIPNPNDMKIYCLDVMNSKIDYKGIQDFIENNIGRYIYSRGIRNKYRLEDDAGGLTIKALRAYNKKIKTDPSTNHFNELILYSFLECVLGAPKIFSKMELQNKSGEYESTSSGMHILSAKKGGIPFNQLIYGATDTVDSLPAAVDNALNQVTKIINNVADEFELIESTILNEFFDADTNKALEEMLIPKKTSGISKPDTAFGLFLGYTVDVVKNPDNLAFRDAVKTKMESDIATIAPYVESKIKALKLEAYSFYIYILPLNNALVDKLDIMKNALGVGE